MKFLKKVELKSVVRTVAYSEGAAEVSALMDLTVFAKMSPV
jgi:hypothetical protein